MTSESLSVTSICNPDELLHSETERVKWYIGAHAIYASQGYRLRFPEGIQPYEGVLITDAEIRRAVGRKLHADLSEYQRYAQQFKEAWQVISEKCMPVARAVYGFEPVGRFEIVPTAYGTLGGQLVMDGPVFCMIPKYRGNASRTETEFIVHEILAHGVTARLRNDTAMDESNPKCSHQMHKERLMDLLGRTFLVRSGMMDPGAIKMQDRARENAAADVDPLYYVDAQNPDEYTLRYEGRFADLVRDLDAKLRNGC